MKRFWQTWLTVFAATTMVGSAEAQTGWNQSAEIGSYQSIVTRAGYGSSTKLPSQESAPSVPGQMTDQPAPAVGQPTQGCSSGNCGSSMAGGYRDCGCAGACDGSCGRSLGDRMGGFFGHGDEGTGSNYVVGIRGLYFNRDHEDDVRIARNAAGDVLLSTTSDINTMGGIDFSLTKRNCDGTGHQIGYWGLYPGTSDATLYGPGLSTYLTGLAAVNVAPLVTDLQTYFNGADDIVQSRTNVFHNLEFNLLRNVGQYTTRHGRTGNFELLGGFRWFQFNEDYRLTANWAAYNPTNVYYDINVDNTLLGFQVGGRTEICMSDRVSLSLLSKLGVFNNHISHDQSITDSNARFAYLTAGGVDDYVYSSDKNDLSLLGELDLGMTYRISSSSRLVFGYRAIGVSGIALAPAQIPNDFTLAADINDINSNGDLILGGGYAGLEFCH